MKSSKKLIVIAASFVLFSFVYAGKMPKENLMPKVVHDVHPTLLGEEKFFAKQKQERQSELDLVKQTGSAKKIIDPQSEKDMKSRARLEEAAETKKYVGKIEQEVFVEEQKAGRGTISPKETMAAWKAEDQEKSRLAQEEAKRVQIQKERLLALDKERAALIKKDQESQSGKIQAMPDHLQKGYELEKSSIMNSEKSAAEKKQALEKLERNMAELKAEFGDKKNVKSEASIEKLSPQQKRSQEVTNITKEIAAVRELPGIVTPKEGARLLTKAADIKQAYDKKIKSIDASKSSDAEKLAQKNTAGEKYLNDLGAFKEKVQALQTKSADQKERSNQILEKTNTALETIKMIRDAGMLSPKDVRTLNKGLVNLKVEHNKQIRAIARSKDTAEEKVYQRKLADEKYMNNLDSYTKKVEVGDRSLFEKKKTKTSKRSSK